MMWISLFESVPNKSGSEWSAGEFLKVLHLTLALLHDQLTENQQIFVHWLRLAKQQSPLGFQWKWRWTSVSNKSFVAAGASAIYCRISLVSCNLVGSASVVDGIKVASRKQRELIAEKCWKWIPCCSVFWRFWNQVRWWWCPRITFCRIRLRDYPLSSYSITRYWHFKGEERDPFLYIQHTAKELEKSVSVVFRWITKDKWKCLLAHLNHISEGTTIITEIIYDR